MQSAALNRFVLHSIPPAHRVAFVVSSPLRHLRPPAATASAVTARRRSIFISASAVRAKSASTPSPSARAARKPSSPGRPRKASSSSNTAQPVDDASLPSGPSSTLVIVESPAKASTIQAILPASEYTVRSCVGHIREIPSSAKRIPAQFKDRGWARLGVDISTDFKPIYVLIAGKQTLVTELRTELRRASRLVLATDDDREGEAISWHLLEVLKPTVPVHRAVFHEITPTAVRAAFENFRPLNMALVDAQETRRVLDRLAGYTMSPLLWRKIARGLSAGRVQSVAMSEIVRREKERLLFKTAFYSSCSATFELDAPGNSRFITSLSAVDSVRLVKGADFADNTGKLKHSIDPQSVRIFDEDQMQKICNAMMNSSDAIVSSVECRRTTRNPPPPLITSTLQQECGNRLGMGAGRTMSIAQKLYETGVITYMRTDNANLSSEAKTICRQCIEESYGKDALAQPDSTGATKRKQKSGSKAKVVQAAHEAIRPAGEKFIHPNDLKNVTDVERSVYTIIYRRALASEMAPAKLDQTTVKLAMTLGDADLSEKQIELKASGSVIVNPGFLSLYQEAVEDGETANEKKPDSSFLPALKEGDRVSLKSTTLLNHETKPPPRFNDASLVKILEERGVGRPSTYAGIIEKLITRGYAYRGRELPPDKKVPSKALVPSLTAFAVENLLSEHFPSFVDAEFTAHMEKALDEIAAGSTNRTSYLQEYYCGTEGLAESVNRKDTDIDARKFKHVYLPNMPSEMKGSVTPSDKSTATGKSPAKRTRKKGSASSSDDESAAKKKTSAKLSIPRTNDGRVDWALFKVLVNSYGPYIEHDGAIVASLPKTTIADDLTSDRLQSTLELAQDPVIGTDPVSGFEVLLKTSSYGPYVQLGRDVDVPAGEKPKRCGLSGMDIGDLTLDIALKLLSLPRVLGNHPRTGAEVRAAIGPYGPYVVHDSTFVSLKKDVHDPHNISFEEAVELIDAAEARKQKRIEAQKEKQATATGKAVGAGSNEDAETETKDKTKGKTRTKAAKQPASDKKPSSGVTSRSKARAKSKV